MFKSRFSLKTMVMTLVILSILYISLRISRFQDKHIQIVSIAREIVVPKEVTWKSEDEAYADEAQRVQSQDIEAQKAIAEAQSQANEAQKSIAEAQNKESEALRAKIVVQSQESEAQRAKEEAQSQEAQSQDGQCSPQNHLMFIKTHKCGSSVLLNLIFRYGHKKDLIFALPESSKDLGYAEFLTSMIPRELLPPNVLVDIFAVHTRLNYTEQMKILHKDTHWVSILREPAAQFESFYGFFRLDRYYPYKFSDLKKVPIENISLPRDRMYGRFGVNQMTYVMGYPDDIFGDALDRAIEELDKLFELVIINEFMDESLVLLRHLMCWSLHDVVAFKKKKRANRNPMDESMRQKLRKLNSADVKLYDHFLARHHRAVQEFGKERMASEVNQLRTLRSAYERACKTSSASEREAVVKQFRNSGQERELGKLDLSEENCMLLNFLEFPMINHIRDNQRERFNGTLT